MPEIIDKKNVFEGWLYAKIGDPWEKEMREIVFNFIDNGSSVIDVGSGTGALALQLAEKCKNVVGIDLSSKQIQYANKLKEKRNISNVEFLHADATKLSEFTNQKFDYATIAFVIHELPKDERHRVINEMKGIAKKLIITDYTVPLPKNLWGILTILVEFIEGISTFRNFKSYNSLGGLDALLNEIGLKIEKEKIDKTETFRVVEVI